MEITEEKLKEIFTKFMKRASAMGGNDEILERAWNMFKEELDASQRNDYGENRT